MIKKFNKFLESIEHDQVPKEDKDEIMEVFKDLFHEFDIYSSENIDSGSGIFYCAYESPYVKKRGRPVGLKGQFGRLKKYAYNFIVDIEFYFLDSIESDDLSNTNDLNTIDRNIKEYAKKYFQISNYIYDETKPRLENMGFKFSVSTDIEDPFSLKGVISEISGGSHIRFTFYF